MFIGLIAALLVAGVSERVACNAAADVYLGHHPAEVLGVIRQMIEVRAVDVEGAFRGIQLCSTIGSQVRTAAIVAGVKNHVGRFAAAQRNRVGVVLGAIAVLVTQ